MSDSKCLFCGEGPDFLAMIPGKVCLRCGDKLQALGVFLMTKKRYEQLTASVAGRGGWPLTDAEIEEGN